MPEMFNKQYQFKGTHAERVNRLAAAFDSDKKARLFSRNIDIYVNAPIIGFLYGRTATVDDTKNPETKQTYTQNIMGEQVIHSSTDLIFNYRLIMLLDKKYEPDEEKRIDKAFRHMGEDPEDMKHFDDYARGGVDVLYEKLIEGSNSPEDYVNRLYDFLSDFQDKFNSGITSDELVALCKK